MSAEAGSNCSRKEAEKKWNMRPQENKLELEIIAHGYALDALKREIGLGLDPASEDYREIAVKVGELQAESAKLKEELKDYCVNNATICYECGKAVKKTDRG